MGYISEKYCIQPGVVVQMIKDGVVDWRIEGYHDFWKFYQELIKTRKTKKQVKDELMAHYCIKNRITYYRMLKKAKELFN